MAHHLQNTCFWQLFAEALGCCPLTQREMRLGIVVYWLEGEGEEGAPVLQLFSSKELTQALAWAEDRRRAGHRHVSISTELDESVGKPGVSAVEGGKTPDG